ncbi:MAG: helix-turn-helix domain-containing protein, partial [Exiguobacterium chiriqhucha]
MHTKETFSELISSKLKLIRTEQGLSQEELCTLVGISKKTLIQIEKRRLNANWTTTVAICALFNQSPYLHSLIGDQPIEFIRLVAHTDPSLATKTLGGHVWWTTIEHQGKYRIQQNMV